jgi:hypothetical protein
MRATRDRSARVRIVAILAIALLASACGSVEYKDTNAAVDARPECAGSTPQPGEPVTSWCRREQSTSWSSDSKTKPVDLSGKHR